MATLIIYASKSRAAEECAFIIEESLVDCVVCNVSRAVPDMEGIDKVIIGSGVRMGKIYKPVTNFIKKNLDVLLTKPVAMYLCNSYPDTVSKVIEKSFPIELTNHAICIMSFGGRPPFTNTQKEVCLNTNNVDEFIKKVLSVN